MSMDINSRYYLFWKEFIWTFFLFNWIHSISWCVVGISILSKCMIAACCQVCGFSDVPYLLNHFHHVWTNNWSAYCLETFPVFDGLLFDSWFSARLGLCSCPAQIFCDLLYHQGTLLSPVVVVQPLGMILILLVLAQQMQALQCFRMGKEVQLLYLQSRSIRLLVEIPT